MVAEIKSMLSRDAQSRTQLHVAIQCGDLAKVKELVASCQLPSTLAMDDMTPLHFTARYPCSKSVEMAKEILATASGKATLNYLTKEKKDTEGGIKQHSALDLAVERENAELMGLLLEQGAKGVAAAKAAKLLDSKDWSASAASQVVQAYLQARVMAAVASAEDVTTQEGANGEATKRRRATAPRQAVVEEEEEEDEALAAAAAAGGKSRGELEYEQMMANMIEEEHQQEKEK